MHRKNTIHELRESSSNYGIEIDLRSMDGEIILNHDPFKPGVLLKDWIKYYHHGTLILNVKEDGLEQEILSIIKSYNISSYFFLDQSFPSLISLAKQKEKNCAVRFSEYECIESVLNLSTKISWVWVDCFSKFILNKETADLLALKDFKICLVSPELQGRSMDAEVKSIVKKIKYDKINIDAVCTKYPEIWELSFHNV